MKKRYFSLLLLGLIGLGLFVYNYWSYSCGRCNAASLLGFSLPAKILIGVNLAAFFSLLLVQCRTRTRLKRDVCTCGQRLHGSWLFCPCCGEGKRGKA